MKLIQVTNRKTAEQFHDVLRVIYKDDPYFVCPLDKDIEAIFNPKKNAYFQDGNAIRWFLTDDDGNLTGRVAAFYNRAKAARFEQKTGGMGFFECVDDSKAASMLFDACRQWLIGEGLEAMDGPINFGENDSYWGLLVDGFENASYGMNYHKPYYRALFEEYGFREYYEQITNKIDLTRPFPERFWKIADWVRQKPGFSFEHFQFKKADKYIHDLKEVYDQAWVYHEHFTPLKIDSVKAELEKARVILDEEFIWFAYHDNQPIAFLVMFPDVNQILRFFDGKLSFFDKLKFLQLRRKKLFTKARITVMGVIPRFQRYGIESAIFWHMDKMMKHKPSYKEVELSWVGDFNPKMQRLHAAVEGKFSKKHITYRIIFDGRPVTKMHTISSESRND